MKRPITALLILSLASCNVPAFAAETVTVEETPAGIETIHETAASIADILAFPPTETPQGLDGTPKLGEQVLLAQGGTSASPLFLQSGTGQETRLSVDTAAINAKPWPTWAKVTVIVGGVSVVALASWAIVEACQHGEHTSGDDSSTHYNIGVGGEGNTVHVRIDSPDTSRTGGY